MVWFSNARDVPTQFMGLHCGQEKGAYVLRLLRPDGSQETRICDDEGVLADLAIALHDALIVRGWQLWPQPGAVSGRTNPDGPHPLPPFVSHPDFRVARSNKC